MAGSLLKLVSLRVFDFGTLAVGAQQTFALVERIDISQHIDGILQVRAHPGTDTTGGTIRFDLYGDGFTRDDPTLTFRTSAPLFTAIALSSVANGLSYGGSISGHCAALTIVGNRTGAGLLLARVTVDLVLRCPDDT
jgi:hypothetical protein